MSAVPSRLSAVTLGARDLPRLRRFQKGLGWEEQASSGHGWASLPVAAR
ncbi:hypothetical protein [Streptomyces sp. TS71-3]|nr:hypothetical protein [Streptomyces sp. TS71-3]